MLYYNLQQLSLIATHILVSYFPARLELTWAEHLTVLHCMGELLGMSCLKYASKGGAYLYSRELGHTLALVKCCTNLKKLPKDKRSSLFCAFARD